MPKSTFQHNRIGLCFGLFHVRWAGGITTTIVTQFYPSERCAFYPDRTYSRRLLRSGRSDGWPFDSYHTRAGLPPVQRGAKPLLGFEAQRICPLDGSDNGQIEMTVGVHREIGKDRFRSFLTHYGKRKMETENRSPAICFPASVRISAFLKRQPARRVVGSTVTAF